MKSEAGSMIRINLLPIKAARKREYVKQQLILGAVLLVGVIVGLFMWYQGMEGQIADKKADITEAKKKIEQYKKTIGEVEKFKGREQMLKKRLEIIGDLIKGKTGPVKVLDHLSQIIPKEVWLTGWSEKAGRVIISGEALSNKHIAMFISAIKKPVEEIGIAGAGDEKTKKKKSYFSGVSLLGTKMVFDSTYKQTFVQFQISLGVNYAI
jgi:type IV pilus assembly protein PilN